MVAEVLPPHSVISQAIHYAENNPNEQPILFLDEINRTTSDVTSGTLTLVTLRRIGDKALPKNLRIIVAGNDKGNVTALDDASVSRFAIINVEPDAHTLIDVLGDNLHPWVKMVLEKHPETIFVKNVDDQQAVEGSDDDDENATVSVFDLFDGSEEIRPFATPRTIDGVSRYLTALSTEKLMSFMATAATTRDGRHVSYLQETIEGLTGHTSFTTLLMGVISDELSKGTTQAGAQRVVKPRIYDTLKAAATTSIDDVTQVISTMTDNDASGCLVFALYERDDNTVIIQALNDRLSRLEKNHLNDLIAFMPLGADDYAQILRDEYDRQVKRICAERPDLSFDPIDDDTIARLVDETWLVDQGARPAIRAIRALIEDMLLAQAANS